MNESYILQQENMTEQQHFSYRQQQSLEQHQLISMDPAYSASSSGSNIATSDVAANSKHSNKTLENNTKGQQQYSERESDQSQANIITPRGVLTNQNTAGQHQYSSSEGIIKRESDLYHHQHVHDQDNHHPGHAGVLYPGHVGKVLMTTPHNSAASSPIPSSVPSPINHIDQSQISIKDLDQSQMSIVTPRGAVTNHSSPAPPDHEMCLEYKSVSSSMPADQQQDYYHKPGDKTEHHHGDVHQDPGEVHHVGDLYHHQPLYRDDRQGEYSEEMYRQVYHPEQSYTSGVRGGGCVQQGYDPYRLGDQHSAEVMMRHHTDYAPHYRSG